MHLGLRIRTSLVLRMRRLLMGWRGMRLRGRMRRRGGIVLSADRRR